MPNWCDNTMTVSGPHDELLAFIKKAEGPTQTYNSYSGQGWEAFDKIRVEAIYNSLPEPGESSDLSFHQLVPVPDATMRLPYDRHEAEKIARVLGYDISGIYGPEAGYEWEANNWGCKWGASNVSRGEVTEPESGGVSDIQYEFSTPWSPPIAALIAISIDFPSLSFSINYDEPGMGFCGDALFKGGDMINHNERSIDDDYEDDYEE